MPVAQEKRVSPHVLRHSTAMNLLEAGVDSSVIALWLGHESVETNSDLLLCQPPTQGAALAKTAATTDANLLASAPMTSSSPSYRAFDYAESRT